MAEPKFKTSLAGRSIVALFLFVGYYVLALILAGSLLLVPYAGVRLSLPSSFYVLALYMACLGAAVLILWSLVPRPERFKAPGLRLTPNSDPRLFEEIFRTARELGQKAPREAYLMADVTAWVAERGGFMGFGSRRIAGVGLSLLQGLSIGEFRAVLAHEFGHFSRGDTRLGPWIYRTRTTIGRTLQKLPALSHFGKTADALGSLLQRPFVLYGNWFLRITQAISRRQEYLADELAAATEGRETMGSALRKTFTTDLALRMYWESMMVPALNAGFLPPFAAGLGQFAAGEAITGDLTRALNWHLENVQSGPHDSHPSDGERIKALAERPAGHEPEAGPPAVTLLEDVPGRERELFAFINPQAGPKLRPLAWGDIVDVVLIPHWAARAKAHQAVLAGLTPGNISDWLPRLAELGQRMAEASGQHLIENQAKSMAAGVIAVAIVTKMIERGWKASYTLGQYTVLRHGERSWEPFRGVYALCGGETAADDWLKLCDELGIGDLDLGSGEQAPKVEPVRQPAEVAAEPPPAAPSLGKRDKPSLVPYVILGLIGLIIAANIFAPRSGPPTGAAPGQPAPRVELPLAMNNPDLRAQVTRWSPGGAVPSASVAVTNNSSKVYHFVMVKVEFIDRTGRVAGTATAEADRTQYILPGRVMIFEVRGYYKLDFETARASVVYAAEAK